MDYKKTATTGIRYKKTKYKYMRNTFDIYTELSKRLKGTNLSWSPNFSLVVPR
jgi:hypothetical protein